MELWTAFLLGLVGSLHCAGMCGPLALALPVPAGGGWTYLTGRVVYNAGRMLTYGVLGLVFGLAGKVLLVAGLQQALSIGLGIALLAGLVASRHLALAAPVGRLLGRLKGAMGGLLRTRSHRALGLLGLLNGLLPCGLVYVACAGAAATGAATAGVGYMLVFGLGTVPMMLAISLSGRLLQVSLRQRLVRLVPVSVFLLATLLILRGMALGIPYVSPDLGAAAPGCCPHGTPSVSP